MEDVLKINAFVMERVQQICDQIKENIRAAGKHVTGDLSDSPQPKVSGSADNINIEIIVAKYFGTIETGRKPTPGIPPSEDMIKNLGEWAASVGLPEEAVWPIAKTIQEEGTKLWQEGGRDDIFSQFFTKEYWGRFREDLSKEAAKNYALHLNKAKKK